MHDAAFDDVVHDQINSMVATLRRKAAEYGRGDRMHNFKVIAAMRQVTPESALIGLVSKQWVSVLDMVMDLDHGIVHPVDAWNEKIGDVINYMVLLKGLVIERAAEAETLKVNDVADTTAPLKLKSQKGKPWTKS